jgi:hypothetical protein
LRSGGGSLLAPEWVAEMGRDQIAPHELADAPGTGLDWAFPFFAIHNSPPRRNPRVPGAGGAYGHAWFVDRARTQRSGL